MKRMCYLWSFVVLALSGCMVTPPLEPVPVTLPSHPVDYLSEIKPILDKRCVVCHSCYNSPCQLKLSSYEGTDRGAVVRPVYDSTRLETMDPTRLFTDAMTTEGWREKGFFSVTESTAAEGFNNSLMVQLLSHKMNNPASVGDYHSEADDLTCSRSTAELSSFLSKHPNRGMPFGFPPLKQQEFELIAGWLAQGAGGPEKWQQEMLEAVPAEDVPHVAKWEAFLNRDEAKYVMTARYLYEHLFLAHIRFGSEGRSFYELVRSRTPTGEPLEIIPSVRPYDDPGGSFYYRFRKIHSTIVYKTHMVFNLDDAVLARYHELFIEPPWLDQPQVMGYGKRESADPFTTFQQIPPRSRYQFLLDNAHFIIMTFIRGPVCKGQVALNVINDHFWLLFLDPDADLAVRYPGFLKLHRDKLRMPAEKGSASSLSKALVNRYHERAMDYHRVRQDFYMAHYYNGMGYDAVWKGNRSSDAPLITVFRHFDSASSHKGALGDLPRTAWVIDYPLFERIYYSLVAGFDIFGNLWHQLTTRLYMDALRREAESNFLDFLPQYRRKEIMRQWYQGMDFFHVRYHETPMPVAIGFATDDPQREFLEHVVSLHLPPDRGIRLDPVNYTAGGNYPPTPVPMNDMHDFLQGLHSVSAPGGSFFARVNDHNANVAYIRVKTANGDDAVISAVINRWHDNVTFLFGEDNTLDPAKDSADFFQGFVGAYPNYFFVVEKTDMAEFISLLHNYRGRDEERQRLRKFGINRNDDRFWEVFDWFQARFHASDPVNSGYFDLNRYYYQGLE